MPSAVVLYNIGTLVTPTGSSAKGGKAQGDILCLHDAYIRIEEDKIADVGTGKPEIRKGELPIDCVGQMATPGLVDPHTHLVFGGWRDNELSLKLHDVPYLNILAAGGGILSTVTATRNATQKELEDKAFSVLGKMLRRGVTTCEAKSGYGLNWEQEKKMLLAVKNLNARQPVEVVSTFMGAHALPPEYKDNWEGYIREITDVMLPAVAREKLAEYCDVFCETGVFTAEESRTILETAKELGLGLKCHSDEIEDIGGTIMAASLGAVSCEHLIRCTPEGIQAMKESGTIACCLPATSFYLGATYAPARQMIDAGVPVAFGSDFNPGSCPCSSLPLAMQIGCYRYHMTPEECLTAVTLNAAAAIGRADRIGTLEVGKQADITFWNANSLAYILYRFGDIPISAVVKNGHAAAAELNEDDYAD